MKHFLKTSMLLLAGLLPAASPAEVPASVSRAVKQANAAATLEVTCKVNGNDAVLTMSGNCFILDLGTGKVYYDGKTQWAYNVTDAEVTVIEPTAEELAESNPLCILRSLEKEYSGAPVRGNANTVRLTPLSAEAEVAEVTVTFSPTTGWPVAMTVIGSGGRSDISELKFTAKDKKTAAAAFRFTAPKGATVTDLR